MGRGGSRITSKRTHLKVGSSEGTAKPQSLPAVSRQDVEASRAQFTSDTLADALAGRASALTDAQIPAFVENMQGALLEAQKGDRRALDTYSLAMNKLFIKNPVRWQSIQVASGMDMPTFAKQFAPQKAAGEIAQANAVDPLQSLPAEQVAGIANQMVDDLAYGRGQSMGEQLAVDPSVGGTLAAQPMPVNPPADPTRADAQWRWADFLGGPNAARAAYFDPRGVDRNDGAKQLFPQIAGMETIRALKEMSGLPFYPVVGPGRAGALDPAVKQAMDMIEGQASYDFDKRTRLRPEIEQQVAAEVMADPSIPEQNREQATSLRVQDQMDAMPVATYPDDLRNKVRELMAQRLMQQPDSPAEFVPSTTPDPVAQQAQLDAEAAQQEAAAAYELDPNFIGPPSGRLAPDAYEQVPGFIGPPSRLAFDEAPQLPVVPDDLNAAPVSVDPTLEMDPAQMQMANNLNRMNFGVRVPGTIDPADITMERDFINQSRSPLDKALEENQMIMEGRGSLPQAVARLLGKVQGVDPDIQSLASAHRGAIYDLDNRVKHWRMGVRIQDPVTGEIRVVPFPPDVLAGLHAQGMGITDPNTVARMIDPMATSIDVYSHLPPTGAAKKLLDDLRGPAYERKPGFIGPPRDMPEPPVANLSRQLLEALGRDIERRQGKKTPTLFSKPKPATPDMTDTSMMPMTDRFATNRMNPLAALIG